MEKLREVVEKHLRDGATKLDLLANVAAGRSAFVRQILEQPHSRQAFESMDLDDFVRVLAHILSMGDMVDPRKRIPAYSTIDKAIELIRNAKKILVLTGAGVSTSCGIPDFRSADGVYSMLGEYKLDDPQDLFTISYFRRNVKPFYDFARKLWPGTHKPAPTHEFIRKLDESGLLLRNYTQNIDTLEYVAGITKVLQCHGSFATATCTRCKFKCKGKEIEEYILNGRIPPCAKCLEDPKPSLMEEFALRYPELLANRSLSITSESDVASSISGIGPPPAASMSSCDGGITIETDQSNTSVEIQQRENQTRPWSSSSGARSGSGKPASFAASAAESSVSSSSSSSSVSNTLVCENVPKGPEIVSPSNAGSSLPFVDPEFDRGIMKPDIVFFGESLPEDFFSCIETDVEECDLVLVMGTSLKVAPVSRVIEMVDPKVPQILINRELVAQPHQFDLELLGNCDGVCIELARRLGWNIVGVDDSSCDNAETKGIYKQSEHFPHRYLFEGAVEHEQSDDSDNDQHDGANGEMGDIKNMEKRDQSHVENEKANNEGSKRTRLE